MWLFFNIKYTIFGISKFGFCCWVSPRCRGDGHVVTKLRGKTLWISKFVFGHQTSQQNFQISKSLSEGEFWELEVRIDVKWPPSKLFKASGILFYGVSMRGVNLEKSTFPNKKHSHPRIAYSKSVRRPKSPGTGQSFWDSSSSASGVSYTSRWAYSGPVMCLSQVGSTRGILTQRLA